jgi:hypothetical protein
MPYYDDGVYIENEPSHGKDADRRFYRNLAAMRDRIERIERIMSDTRVRATVLARLKEERIDLILSLHDARNAGAKYDERLAEAMADPTGQLLDTFYGDS